MALTGPFSVTYPVNFYSGGDTTKEAFGKHIQEIQKIYGILNSLNSDKVSADELTSKLQAHINDSNPHPNLNLANTQGNLSSSRVTGNFDFSRITGNLDASRITGYFDTSRISGLESYVKDISKKAIGDELNGATYMKVGNILLQWGLFQMPEITAGTPANFTINLPQNYGYFNYNHYQNGVLQKTTQHAYYIVEAFVVANNYEGSNITLDLHEDYTIEQGKKPNSFIVTATLSHSNQAHNMHLLWNAWGIGA